MFIPLYSGRCKCCNYVNIYLDDPTDHLDEQWYYDNPVLDVICVKCGSDEVKMMFRHFVNSDSILEYLHKTYRLQKYIIVNFD